MKPKVLFIVGPTGVGKTALAFSLAKKFNGALISADSVQVFKKLDIISGKDIPKTSKFVPLPELSDGFNAGYFIYNGIDIFLLDVVDPDETFSVSQFHNIASKSLEYILAKNKLPIVVGGTGLYVQSLINGLDSLSEPDLKLRGVLNKLSVSELQNKLQSLDDRKFKNLTESDRSNPRRLIRAIEVSTNGKWHMLDGNKEKNYNSLVIGLECERDVLKQRINKRVEERLKNGALREVQTLFRNYKNLSQQVKDANGYKQLFSYLKHEISLEEAIYRWKISEYRHAKNQMTWFKKNGNVEWFDIGNSNMKKDILKKIEEFLKN